MDVELQTLIAAFGGGAFGTAVGGQPSFILTGFAGLIGCALLLVGAKYNFNGEVTFGPIFGPHVAFVGGVAGAAYAARRGLLESGRDIATPVTSSPIPLIIGGVFGMGGYLFNQFLIEVVTIDGVTYTDTIAFTVFFGNVVARLVFGRSGLFGKMSEDHLTEGRGRYSLSSTAVWVGHQGSWPMTALLGLAVGLISTYAMVTITEALGADVAASVVVLLWAFSAVSLLLLQFGQPGPVTHHIGLPAAVAATAVLTNGGSTELAWVIGVAGGIAGALIGEAAARIFIIHGDTHIDPPAIGIFMVNTIVAICVQIFV
jgi:hypothetical protein